MTPSGPWYLNPLFLTPVFGFIGVIIGALISGFLGWFIAEANRSHEFERERRRRKQDCLEAVMERADEADAAVREFCVSCLTQRDAYENAANVTPDEQKRGLTRCTEQTTETSVKATEAMDNLQRYRTKLSVFGFSECAESVVECCKAMLRLKIVAGEMRDGAKTREDYQATRQIFAQRADDRRAVLTAAFATL